MSLKDNIQAAVKKPGGKCTLGLVLKQMSPKDRRELDECLSDLAFSHAQIARGVSKDPRYTLRPEAVRRHRAQECACSDVGAI